MDIADLGAAPNADPLVQDIFRFGLAENIVELEAYGFTVVPPEKMQAPPDFADRLRSALLRIHEERTGDAVGDYQVADYQTGKTWWLLEGDDAVVESVLNPVVLTMARWLCGQSAVLSGTTMILKPRAEIPVLGVHTDTHAVPSPTSTTAHMCNTSWILSDYDSEDDGPTGLVPGSHRFGRVPQPYERPGPPEGATWRVVPLKAKAGSLAIWHGNTWHAGGLSRRRDGLRVTLVLPWARTYMKAIHEWRDGVSPELVERFPELKRVLGFDHPYPWREQNEHFERVAPFIELGRDPFA